MTKQSIFSSITNDEEAKELISMILEDKLSVSKQDILDCILVASFNEIDFDLADRVCRKYITSDDPDIKGLTMTAVGHIARVYDRLVDPFTLQCVIDSYLGNDIDLSGQAGSALDDIDNFLGINYLQLKKQPIS
ncbi:hypothetical protein [Candidatus Odyssella thessalonicensis]|uniref:hypothetical protein n=1 Tax=Candidatus Odyssella thessalonicensis TaxID=84647 RepID=UPI000225AF9B|nr:hypothetical protein [Candidatus Odyssella thessalonicensis]